MKRRAIAFNWSFQDGSPRVAKKTYLVLRAAGLDCRRKRQDRCDDALLLQHDTARFLVELNQIHGVVGHLLAIGSAKFRALEFDDSDDAVTKQNAVHSQATSSEIKLEKYVTKGRQVLSG